MFRSADEAAVFSPLITASMSMMLTLHIPTINLVINQYMKSNNGTRSLSLFDQCAVV
jgi:hypothetical protein